ncbi:hypothetical protein ABT127_26910 [Streptomyces sp. NPDC001904]|uniref:hypothetical protein n=1 Tax=Streptomyces sp. NPDC001904 TaxID=3154531 RepID=UPI00332424BD
MQGWQFWWGITAFFLGGLATQLTGWLTYRRQQKDKAVEAKKVLLQRREEFELRHLVEVNQLLRALGRSVDDYAAARCSYPGPTGGEEAVRGQEDAAYLAAREADAELSAQVGFILDDDVRSCVSEARRVSWDRLAVMLEAPRSASFADVFLGGADIAGPYTLLLEMADASSAAYESISARVRALYAGGEGQSSLAQRSRQAATG